MRIIGLSYETENSGYIFQISLNSLCLIPEPRRYSPPSSTKHFTVLMVNHAKVWPGDPRRIIAEFLNMWPPHTSIIGSSKYSKYQISTIRPGYFVITVRVLTSLADFRILIQIKNKLLGLSWAKLSTKLASLAISGCLPLRSSSIENQQNVNIFRKAINLETPY